MVEALRAQGVRSDLVLAAMGKVPRHAFIESGLASRAYEDMALPIGQGQTISKPSTVARMIELLVRDRSVLELRTAKVLEVGTGCGYQAAVLAHVFGEVVSIERLRWLHEAARTHIRPLRLPNLRLVFGDGWQGVEAASAGTDDQANVPLDADAIEWADVIFVMEASHKSRVTKRFGYQVRNKRIVVLGIPDKYQFMAPDLVKILERKVGPHLVRLGATPADQE